ncbi:APG9-domain-containing protein [Lactarius indigo]|nr:APG9-domain-containing protein [Lactarius indigo]
MSSPPNSRRLSRSATQSIYAPTASSRPFLNMLNPLGRAYQGYTVANQSVLEEPEEDNDGAASPRNDDIDLEAQAHLTPTTKTSVSAPRVPRGGTDASILRPNVREDDRIQEESESDGEVPQSLLIESPAVHRAPLSRKGRPREVRYASQTAAPADPPRISVPPRPSEIGAEVPPPRRSSAPTPPNPKRGLDAYERALWNWVNVYNLDAFLQEVYLYYHGKGIYSIALKRGLNLLTVGFVIGFSTFLLRCVTRLSDIVVERCVSRFSGFTLLFFLLFCAFYVWQIALFVLSVMRLVDMYRFYTYLLQIPDEDIQTISWPEVVRRIGAIRNSNPLTELSSSSSRPRASEGAKLDAHDIANRIMRQENFLISLFNKELLDLRVPLPNGWPTEEGKGRTLTRSLEWNLQFCLMEYLFDRRGQVRKVLHACIGSDGVFIFMGILNAIFAPFIVVYLLMYSFFRYFEESYKNPSAISGRAYTPFAHWKFREFNELPHLFERRTQGIIPYRQHVHGFLAFIAGSFAAVLLLATVLFYLSVFGGILARRTRVFDSEVLMEALVQYTHYLPDEWRAQLHAKTVHTQFGELFQMKVVTFVTELTSVVLTPFILWFALPPCAPAIVDFFREFTVHVDGLGYVCSFAVFDFQRHGNVKFGAPTNMEKSFVSFKACAPGTPASIVIPPADRAQEYERALQESRSAAVRRRGGSGFGTASKMLGQSGTMATSVYQLGMAESIALGDSDGSVAHAQLQAPSQGANVAATAAHGHMSIPSGSGELAADSEGDVRSGLGESYVDGARRHARGGLGRSTQEEEDDGLGADGGVLGLLAQIYNGTAGGGPRGVLQQR